MRIWQQDFPYDSVVKKIFLSMQEIQEMCVQFLGWEDPLEQGIALQYFCLENPMDKGGLVHKVTKR